MAINYTPTTWREDGVTQYGANAFNNIEGGIMALINALNGGAGNSAYVKKQTENLAKAMKKLRMGENTEVCFFGDSVFYGYYKGTDKVEEDCIPDKNTPYSVRYGKMPTRNPVTIYDSFLNVMNKTFDNKISLKKKLFSGHTTKMAYEDYNASNSDFVIINFGINDALGAHIQAPYKGDVIQFLDYYRKIIEREIDGGTAVILVTPVKLTTVVGSTDMDDRTLTDIYEQATVNLAREYNCVCILGNDMVKNFGIDLSEDFCHYTAEGNKAIGYRLASPFIGQSPLSPMWVSSGSYLAVNPQMDNMNVVAPAELISTDISPNLPAMISSGNLEYPVVRVNRGLQCNVTGNGSIVWSFYCEHDGMVIIPSVYTQDENTGVVMKLDYGSKQGKWNNYWNFVSSEGSINRDYEESTVVEVPYSNFVTHISGKSYGLHCLRNSSQPVLKVTTKGWHTLQITPKFPQVAPQSEISPMSVVPDPSGDQTLCVFGINFLSMDDYNKRIV